MNESMFKRIWNHTISVGQIIITFTIMGLSAVAVGLIVCVLRMIFRPSKD